MFVSIQLALLKRSTTLDINILQYLETFHKTSNHQTLCDSTPTRAPWHLDSLASSTITSNYRSTSTSNLKKPCRQQWKLLPFSTIHHLYGNYRIMSTNSVHAARHPNTRQKIVTTSKVEEGNSHQKHYLTSTRNTA